MDEKNQPNSWWPQKEDTLFASGIDWERDALIDGLWNSFLGYALGYKEAADSVVAAVEARKVAPDLVVYAVCFLYRHYLELMLKELIRLGGRFHDRRVDVPKHHKLRELWEVCRPLLEHACPDSDPVDMNAVEARIREFASLDPSGEAFRYGEAKNGNPSFAERTQFSLTNMRDVMNRLSGFFEGTYDYMDELIQYQADVDAESL